MVKIKMKSPIDLLIMKYQRIIQELVVLEKSSPKQATLLLQELCEIETQIEELKIAEKN